MNDWQAIVIDELKSLNRKLEKVSDKIDKDTEKIELKLENLDDKVDRELEPIKAHITKVKFSAVALVVIVPVVLAVIRIWL
jgi:t-SNARE complex subunit (syntaxin)